MKSVLIDLNNGANSGSYQAAKQGQLDGGNNIYADTHQPAFGSIDSHNLAVKWLIKRMPLAKNNYFTFFKTLKF